MPRTDSPKKRSIRFCGDCGYELARDNDGTCPMCRRFEQLRSDFIVPRPGDIARQQAAGAYGSTAEEWPPTVAEYRAVLAERRARLASPREDAARVLRTPGLLQTAVPPQLGGATGLGEEQANFVLPEPPPEDTVPDTVKSREATATAEPVRARQAKGRRAARRRGRSSGKLGASAPRATASSAAVEPNDLLAAPIRTAQAVAPSSVAAAPTRSESIATTTERGPSLMPAGPARDRPHRSGLRVPLPAVITAAALALSALFGAAVSLLLSSP